jgi:hypothetical protein
MKHLALFTTCSALTLLAWALPACTEDDSASDDAASGGAGAGGAGLGGGAGSPAETCLEVLDDVRMNATWTDRVADPELPDVCVRADVQVADNALLTVEPGVRIQFDAGTSLVVTRADGAALRADGSATAPIVWYGAEQEPGFWDGLEIASDDPRNRLTHCVLRDAGGGGEVTADDALADLRLDAALILDAEPGEPARATIDHVSFSDNAGWGLVVEWISEVDGLEELAFERNAEGALLLSPINVDRAGSTLSFADNGFDGVAITGTPNLELPRTATWKALVDGARYWVREPVRVYTDLTIEAGTALVFAPGTGLEFPQNSTNTRASFAVLGNAAAPVTFAPEENLPGYWTGIELETGHPANRIEHADIGFAEKGIRLHKSGAFPAASVDLESVHIHDSSACGVENTSASNSLTLSDVTYENNVTDECLPAP